MLACYSNRIVVAVAVQLQLLVALPCALAQRDPPPTDFETDGLEYISGNVTLLFATTTSFFVSLDRNNDPVIYYRINPRDDGAASMIATIRQAVRLWKPVGLYYDAPSGNTADVAAVLLELRPADTAIDGRLESTIRPSASATYDPAGIAVELEPDVPPLEDAEPLPTGDVDPLPVNGRNRDSSGEFVRLQNVQIQMGRIATAEPCGPVPQGAPIKVVAGIGVAGGLSPHPAHFFRLQYDVIDGSGSSVIQGSAPKTLLAGETDVLALSGRLNVPAGTYTLKVAVDYFDLATSSSVTLDEFECQITVQAHGATDFIEPVPSAE